MENATPCEETQPGAEEKEEWRRRHEERRQEYREWRKQITSKAAYECHVFDEAAMAAANDETKSWIETTVENGEGFVIKGDPSLYMNSLDRQEFGYVLENFKKHYPNYIDDDLMPSLYAYFVACRGHLDDFVVFVTGSNKMLKLFVEEDTREELHACVRGWSFPGVRQYMFMNDDGQLRRANLKWNAVETTSGIKEA